MRRKKRKKEPQNEDDFSLKEKDGQSKGKMIKNFTTLKVILNKESVQAKFTNQI